MCQSGESWIDNYFELLTRGTEAGQREALALKRSNFPEALYRYRSLERLAYRLEELRDGYVFRTNPANFTDPYDSALSASSEQFRRQVLEKVGPEYGLSYDQDAESKFLESLGEKEKEQWRIEQELEQLSHEYLLAGFMSLIYGPCDVSSVSSKDVFSVLESIANGRNASPEKHAAFSILRNPVRVSCFATNPKSVVMWSHYAKNHTGICVEYPRSAMLADAKVLELLHPVRYTETLWDASQLPWPIMPGIEINQVPSQSPLEAWPIVAACHKSKDWAYEREWRLVSLDPESRKEPKFFLRSYGVRPSRIILGARIDEADRAAIKDLAQKISVPVVNAHLAKERFEIGF